VVAMMCSNNDRYKQYIAKSEHTVDAEKWLTIQKQKWLRD